MRDIESRNQYLKVGVMMNERSLRNEIGFWSGIIFGAASFISLLLDHWVVASYLVLLCSFMVLGYLAYRYRKERQAYRQLLSAFRHIHQLPHDLRDTLASATLLKTYSQQEAHEDLLTSSTIKVLDASANLFTRIIGIPCYANLMMPDSANSEKLIPVLWSTNTSPDRRTKKPVTEIPIGYGVAGRAFSELQVKITNDINHSDFVRVPGKETVSYKSVISCPYQVNGTTAGVVNIDCEVKDAFKPEEVQLLVQAMTDTLALVIQLLEGIREIRLEKNILDEKNK